MERLKIDYGKTTPRQDREIAKRLHRFEAFMRRFEVDVDLGVKQAKQVVEMLITDFDSNDYFALHRKINSKFYSRKDEEKRNIFYHRKEVF